MGYKDHSLTNIFESTDSLYEAIIQGSPYGIVILEKESLEILYSNKISEQLIGYSVNDLLGREWSSVDEFADDDVFQSNLRLLERNKIESFLSTHRFALKDGKKKNFSFRTNSLPLKEKIYYLLHLFPAVNEPLLGIEHFDKTYRQIFEQAPIGILIGHRIGHLIPNPKLCEMTGFQKEEWGEMSTAVFSHPEDEQFFLEQRALLYSNKINHINLEKRYTRKDGSIFWANIFVFPIRNLKGVLESDISFIMDITNERLTKEQIISSNEKYFDLFENMTDALVVLDSERRITNANLAAQKLFGKSISFLKNERLENLADEKDKDLLEERLNELSNRKYLSDLNFRIFITENNSFKRVRMNSNAIFENEKFVGTRNIIRDVTQELEAIEKREELFNRLRMANQELKDFAYVVSHDLKAPLRAISSIAQWLSEDYRDKLDEEGSMQLDLLTARVRRMYNFIEGILEYSRIGRVEDKLEIIDLNALLKEVVDTLAPPDHFTISIPPNLPQTKANRFRLFQVFQNLLSNAIKYNDKDKGFIEVSFVEEENFWRFWVKDNGPGISPKYHKKVFQLFQTLQSRDIVESTGLGLSIVRRIIELQKGEIFISSKEGESTTFEFTLSKNKDIYEE